MARSLLTALAIKHAKKDKLSDGEGLYLHRAKSGTWYWAFIYTRHGRRREMSLGPYGAGTGQVSIAAARRKADEVREIIGAGGNPFTEMAERKARVPLVTFGTVADEYIDAMKSQWRGRATEAGWRRVATVYAKGLRRIPVAEVTTEDVVRVLKPIWTSMPETAQKTRERVKLILDHAKARGIRTGPNPAEWKGHLDQILPRRDPLQKRNHAAMPYPDLPAFMAALRKANGTAARCLEFTILTAARSGEARGAVWSELDLAAKVWTIPAGRMKAGREHRVPLSARAVELLEVQKARALSDLVFPGQSAKRQMSDPALAKVLTANGGTGFTVHGMRSAFRDWVSEETDFQREVAEAALAHAVGDQVERAYRRGDALAKRRLLMDAWASFCAGSN